MNEIETLRRQIATALEEESRVTVRILGDAFGTAMGIESRAYLDREVEAFARQHGWDVRSRGDCFEFSKA